MRTFRLQLGLSQEALANLCGLHRTYISSVERSSRNIGIDNVERIALALDRPIASFFPETGAKAMSINRSEKLS